MKNIKKFAILLLFLLISTVVLTACSPDTSDIDGNDEQELPVFDIPERSERDDEDDTEADITAPAPVVDFFADAEKITLDELASMLQEEFEERPRVEFFEPHFGVPRDSTITFELEFEISLEDAERYFGVYIDSALTERVSAFIHTHTHRDFPDELPEGHSWVHILPPRFSVPGNVGNMSIDALTGDFLLFPGSGRYNLREPEGYDWGFFSQYYIVQRIDLETGVPLEIPWATPFTLESELDAPVSEFFVTPEGLGGFRWDPIEGADFYVIVRFCTHFNDGLSGHTTFDPVYLVTETYWIHPESNDGFHNNLIFDQRWWENSYSVIAVNSATHSAIGNIHSGREIGPRIPLVWDFQYHDFETGGIEEGFVFFITNIGLLPSHIPIRMANDDVVFYRIIYDFDSAVRHTYRGFGFSGITSRHNVSIPFTVEGTPFHAHMVVDAPNQDTYRDELNAMRERLEKLSSRGGGTTAVSFSQALLDAILGQVEVPDLSAEIAFRENDLIYANSALSAFFAHNMLVVNEVVDLSLFPESVNRDYLLDAFFEALFQNPLIMHVHGVSFIPDTNAVFIHYRKPAEVILAQQDALRRIIPEIVSQIITVGMTDLEISKAINRFLVETAEYDWAALDSAEQNNFLSVDAIYYDSFTAYGILINRVGVCSGYAAAYHLLAHAAGLRSIVVTGYLEGFLPHAWNRTLINGHWHTVDVTNNASELLPNAFLHLSDSMARSMLVEDNRFVLDDFLAFYRSNSNAYEYYITTGRFFPLSAIAEELSTALAAYGSAVLRTDYNLTYAQFSQVVRDVMGRLGVTEILATQMLGVISLSKG